MPKTPEEIDDLNAHLQTLITRYGSRRALLHREDKVCEEVWVVFVDDIGAHKYASNVSYNEAFTVRLLNRPADFAGKDWGDQIKVRTNRSSRPYALEFENKPSPIVPPVPDEDPYPGWCGY